MLLLIYRLVKEFHKSFLCIGCTGEAAQIKNPALSFPAQAGTSSTGYYGSDKNHKKIRCSVFYHLELADRYSGSRRLD